MPPIFRITLKSTKTYLKICINENLKMLFSFVNSYCTSARKLLLIVAGFHAGDIFKHFIAVQKIGLVHRDSQIAQNSIFLHLFSIFRNYSIKKVVIL